MVRTTNLFGDVKDIIDIYISPDIITQCFDELYSENFDETEYQLACFRYAIENYVLKTNNKTSTKVENCVRNIIRSETLNTIINRVTSKFEPINGDYLLHLTYIIEHLAFSMRYEKMKRT